MAIGQFSSPDSAEPISEINTTPFVDVMLVLLIIFIVTAPLMTQGLSLALPEADAPQLTSSTPTIRIEVKADGEVFLDGIAAASGQEALLAQLTEKTRTTPAAQVQIRADGATPYARIAEIISVTQAAGLTQIAFITAAPTAPVKTPTQGGETPDPAPRSRPPQ